MKDSKSTDIDQGLKSDGWEIVNVPSFSTDPLGFIENDLAKCGWEDKAGHESRLHNFLAWQDDDTIVQAIANWMIMFRKEPDSKTYFKKTVKY